MNTITGVIVPESGNFSHHEAMRVYKAVLESKQTAVVIDLSQARDATSAAFARLVLLRRALREEGRDMSVANLRDRAARVYHLNKLGCVLPEAPSLPN